ncbi:MAG TPA: E3 binding domain-containing protein [Rubrobacter sp.]
MAKKKDKAIKSLKKDLARLEKQNDELAEKLEQTREDQAAELSEIRNLIEERLAAQDVGPAEPSQQDYSPDGEEEPEITEAAELRAKDLGVDLSDTKGTGSGGRILVKDVEAAADAK